MPKDFKLVLMTTALPALLASCVDDHPNHGGQTYTIPDGCYIEADGEVECGDDGHSSHSSSSHSKSKAVGVMTGKAISSTSRVSTTPPARVQASPSVSRGGFATAGRASGSVGG